MKHEPKALRNFVKKSTEISIQKSKWSCFYLSKVFLHTRMLEEPYVTHDIGEEYLKKYSPYSENLGDYFGRISAWRYDIDEIADLS